MRGWEGLWFVSAKDLSIYVSWTQGRGDLSSSGTCRLPLSGSVYGWLIGYGVGSDYLYRLLWCAGWYRECCTVFVLCEMKEPVITSGTATRYMKFSQEAIACCESKFWIGYERESHLTWTTGFAKQQVDAAGRGCAVVGVRAFCALQQPNCEGSLGELFICWFCCRLGPIHSRDWGFKLWRPWNSALGALQTLLHGTMDSMLLNCEKVESTWAVSPAQSHNF